MCEGGVTNYGDLTLAKQQADTARAVGADIVKFQAWKTEHLISRKVSKRLAPELGYDWFERLKCKELSFDELKKLYEYCIRIGISCFATAHDDVSLDFLHREIAQQFFKVGSGESHNFEFLKNVGSRGKPVIISFGLQSEAEVLKAVEVLRSAGTREIIALHCTSLYPTPYDMVGLARMLYLKELTGLPVGISDHSVGWHVVLAAVALGAHLVEKHLTFDKNDHRSLDNPGALLPGEFMLMVRQIRDIEQAMRSMSEFERMRGLEAARDWAAQSLVAARDIPAETVLTREMIAFKRPPRGGLPPEALYSVIGKKTKIGIEEDEQILLEYLL